MTLHKLTAAAAACLALLASGAAHAQFTRLTITQDASGTLFVGNGANGNKNVKIEVGPSAGQVRVIDQAAPGPVSFSGVSAVRVNTGSGNDQIEFDINASQSLALAIDTGSGSANMKVQWKVPRGAASTVSRVDMIVSSGDVNVELDHESETADATFNWTSQFGGGNKVIKGGVEFKEGTQTARQNISLSNFGAGSHLAVIETESKAANAFLDLNTGNATEVSYKVTSADRSNRLVANTTVSSNKTGIEILSAAPTTEVRLNGGTGLSLLAETNFGVVQTVPGTLAAQLGFASRSNASKFSAKFDGASSNLSLGGQLLGNDGRDEFKIETNARATATLLIDAGAGDNVIDFGTSGALLAGATPLRLVAGAGNDLINLLAGLGSTALPVIDCGAGSDNAKGSVGTPIGCELFSR